MHSLWLLLAISFAKPSFQGNLEGTVTAIHTRTGKRHLLRQEGASERKPLLRGRAAGFHGSYQSILALGGLGVPLSALPMSLFHRFHPSVFIVGNFGSPSLKTPTSTRGGEMEARMCLR